MARIDVDNDSILAGLEMPRGSHYQILYTVSFEIQVFKINLICKWNSFQWQHPRRQQVPSLRKER